MALNPKYSSETVNAEADALAGLLDNGYLRVYDGTQPATADTAITTQTLLAELRFSPTSAPPAVDGLLTFEPITADASANATGTATWARALTSFEDAVMDGSVGTAAADFIINDTAITAGAQVSCAGLTLQVSKG
jgi:hypothetical protein